MNHYPSSLAARYQLDEQPQCAAELVTQIGRRRGCLAAGGQVDEQRASELLLRELRAGLIGRVSLERPEDLVANNEDDS